MALAGGSLLTVCTPHACSDMLRSLFFTRRGSIHGRRGLRFASYPPPPVSKCVHFLLMNTLEFVRIFRRIFCKLGPED